MEGKLIRVDRNGTQYFEGMVSCDRCGGAGGADAWAYTGWTCYKCGGSGKQFATWKVYTPEYEEKLAEQRRKRAEKKFQEQLAKAPELKAEWLEKNGFNADGKTYLFLGNTYEQKEEIKAVGGKFDNLLNWHISAPVEGYKFLEISVEEVADEHIWNGYEFNMDKCATLKDRKREAENKDKPDAGYYGEVGNKVSLELTYVNHAAWENSFGYYGGITILYIFKDSEGHIFTWKTSKWINAIDDDVKEFHVTGTIKEHNEYNGQKQTVLTRCKVA